MVDLSYIHENPKQKRKLSGESHDLWSVLFFSYVVMIYVQIQLDVDDIENILNSLVQLDVVNTL